jgi:TPP-dependent indolepyruvate ferredoxin oxidoreductase alpha subunit
VAASVAHISFAGGGFIVAAHTPYERQLLVEHVLDRARTHQRVQVAVGRQTWLIERPDGQTRPRCDGCKRCINVATCRSRHDSASAVYCVACALR